MRVLSYNNNQTKHILVLEDLEEETTQQDFLFQCSGPHSKLEIMFIESLVLPVQIIEVLVNLMEQYGNDTFKIYTTTEYLCQYLFGLRIPNSQIKTPIQIRREKVQDLINFSENKLRDFLTGIHKIYGYDFSNYQFENIKRIVSQIMVKEAILDFDKYKKRVLLEHEIFQRLFLSLSVNVTSFYRDPDYFKVLRTEVFPYLNSFPHLRIWSVGTASGEEAYSLAILLEELNMLEKCVIYATDFNSLVLQKAHNGLYSLPSLRQAVENHRQAGGSKQLVDYFYINHHYAQIKPSIKKKVVLFHHNLTNDTVFNEFHLIICKNVLIYFNSQLQNNVINLFKQSLHRNVFLVLGRSENIFRNGKDFVKYNTGFNIFKQLNSSIE